MSILLASVLALFTSPGFDSLCRATVIPVAGKPGAWQLDHPRYAVVGDTLYATQRTGPGFAPWAVVRVGERLEEVVRFPARIRDLEFHDGLLWLLFADSLVSVDPASGAVVRDVRIPGEAGDIHAEAQAMAWMGDQLVIALGTRGMIVWAHGGFTKVHDLGLHDGPRLSKAAEVVAVDDHRVVFAIDNVTVSEAPPWALNGLLVADFTGSQFLRRLQFADGSIGEPYLQMRDGDQLVINNWGVLQTTSLRASLAAGVVKTAWVPTRFRGEFLELMGDFRVEGSTLHACGHYSYRDPVSGRPVHAGTPYSVGL